MSVETKTKTLNTQVKLAARPVGRPKDTDWTIEKTAIPSIKEGEILLKVLYISLDPAMRGWMNESKSYIAPVGIAEVMRAGTLSKVIESKNPDFKEGDYVVGGQGVQQYDVVAGDMLKQLNKVMPNIAPLPKFLSVLGMTGMTAYFGLLEIGQPKAGETILVSGAAGAVGSIVGQIAKIKDCTVVGIAGGKEKKKYVEEELGFDSCIDYKNEDLKKALKQHCPNGVDVYFDNVGGETLDIALTRINRGARIPICGAISQYNNTTPIKGPSNYLSLLVNRARMEGFVVFDFASKYMQATMEMAQWMNAGKLKSKEHIVEGIEKFPEHLLMLFDGKNQGKLILKANDDE